VTEQASIDEIDAYTTVSSSADSRLSAIDSALGNIVDKMIEARSALQSSMGSTANQTVRDAAASTFEAVRDAIAADINSTFGGTHLFSGSNSGARAYEKVAGVWTYQGSNDVTTVEITGNDSVAVTMDGEALLKGSDSSDLLTVLDSLAAAARAGDAATLTGGLDQLQRAFSRVTQAHSQVGYDQDSVSAGNLRRTSQRAAAMERLAEDRDANMAEVLTRMSRAQTAYQAALGAVAATSKTSLMDYLK
jgi:flagellin-like hook-associated protein FlgL